MNNSKKTDLTNFSYFWLFLTENVTGPVTRVETTVQAISNVEWDVYKSIGIDWNDDDKLLS